MDVDQNLINLLVAYAANVGGDATRWVGAKFRRTAVATGNDNVRALNLSVQAQLIGTGVENADAETIATFLLETPILGYLFMLVEAAAKSEDYEGFPQEEIAGLLALEAGLSALSSSKAAACLVAVLEASNRAGARTNRSGPIYPSARPLSGIQLFGAQQAKRRFLSEVGSVNSEELLDYTKLYRTAMHRKYSRIQLQHLDNGVEQQLEDLYVEPDLLLQDAYQGESNVLRPAQLLDFSARAVIQGPAGSGKSTTVRRLAAELAGRDDGHVVPIVVELRKYSAQQTLAPQVFLEHIQQSVAQLTQQDAPAFWLQYMLATGRAVVFFDGLDEVLNAGTRSEVRDAVLSFAQIFPASSIIVTSRFTGYDLAPLNAGEWTHVKVCKLRDDQVHDYAMRWFKLKNVDSDYAGRAASFIDESQAYAQDLRENPLMLSLLCSVYYMRGDIPRTLHTLYERCADMIYQQWNTMRGIDDHRAWDKDVRPVLYQVAHAVLNNVDYMSFGIPEDELVSEIRQAFMTNGAPDPEEASRRARETVRLWEGRAWILTAVMTDANSRSRYGFVHQSFLEYFAAVYEVRRVDSPVQLYDNLRSRLIELNGWTVTQIAVSVIQDWRDRGGERFIEALLDEADDACDLDAFALWRLAVSLVSIVPVPPAQLAKIVRGCVRFVGRSVILPTGDTATFEAVDEDRNRTLDLNEFERVFVKAEGSDADGRRRQIVFPTEKSDAVLRDLATLEVTNLGMETLIAEATIECLKDDESEVRLAALLQTAILKSASRWPDAFDERTRAQLERNVDQNWVVVWAAAQVGVLSVVAALPQVPWHALFLKQALVLSDEIEMFGPEPLTGQLLECIEDCFSYSLLESVGEAASRDHAKGRILPLVTKSQAANYFVFAVPESDWQQARQTDRWSDAFLVTFAMLGKLASLAWDTGLALGELVDESPRKIVRQIAAASVGWGRIDEDLLLEISEPYRSAIRSILSSAWPLESARSSGL